MPWIKQIPVEEATGWLKLQFDAALKRAGHIGNIIHVMSVNPRLMRDSLAFFMTTVRGESPLSHIQREMLATVVSVENNCHY